MLDNERDTKFSSVSFFFIILIRPYLNINKENKVQPKETKRKEIYFPIQKFPKMCPKISLSTSYSPVIFPK